jgi:glycosyltransferase involved in cell wall biosynthesis
MSNRGRPEFSVIMTHGNCERFLDSAVASILEQTACDLELILLDDNSESREWLSAIAPFRHDTRLRVYQATANVGPFQLKNRGVELARGKCLAFQDADDQSYHHRLEIQSRELNRGIADIVGCGVQRITEEGEIIESWRMLRAVNFWIKAGNVDCILGATIVLPRTVFERLGGFDPTSRFGGDTDFILRAAHRYRLRNVKEVLYVYRIRQGSLCRDPRTGLGSPDREEHDRRMWIRERARREARTDDELEALIKPERSEIRFDLVEC